MSVNIYDSQSGNLQNVASGQRTWVGTQAAYKSAKQAGTLPNNAIIAITDDEKDHNHYSTDEVETGMYWIDGKPIYRKVVDFGALPNATTKDVALNVSDISEIISFYGRGRNTSGTTINLPFVGGRSDQSDRVNFYIKYNTHADCTTFMNMSEYNATVIIEYTKTTD